MILDRVFPLPIKLKEADMMVLDNEGNSNGCSESFQIVSSEVFPLGINSSTDDLHRFFQYLSVAVQKRYVKPHNIKKSKVFKSIANWCNYPSFDLTCLSDLKMILIALLLF